MSHLAALGAIMFISKSPVGLEITSPNPNLCKEAPHWLWEHAD